MKLILFCDYGLDDALATYDALAHAFEDGYDGVDLVAVAGNVPAEVSLANAHKLVAQLDFSMPPVRIVDTTDILQPHEFLKLIHGDDGMGDLFEHQTSTAPVLKYGDWLAEERGAFDLVSLGPMNLVPSLLHRAVPGRFVFMGGNIAEEPNFHGYEFNHALDRAAFAEAVRYPHLAVTMDSCRHPLFNIQKEALAGGGTARRIANRAREFTFRSGEKGCYIWDDIAVKALRHPDWFERYEGIDRDGNRLTVARYIHGRTFQEIISE